jgi:hypothetical protein
MNKLFGANWWTTVWGSITTVSAAIAIKPELIAFLPDNYEPTVSGVAVFIFVLSGGVFAHGVKSKNVTGGTVQQTASGAPAAPGTQDMVDLTVKATKESGEKVPYNLKTPPPN